MATLYVGYDLGDGETLISFAEYINDGKGKNCIRKSKVRMPGEKFEGIPIPTAYGIDQAGVIKLGKGLPSVIGMKKVFSNFKKRPIELLHNLNPDTYKEDYKEFFDDNSIWPQNIVTNELETMKNHIVTFTDSLFTEEKVRDSLNTATKDKDNIVFAIGHPTKWNAKDNKYIGLDLAIYKKIFKQTIIGQEIFAVNADTQLPSMIIYDAESRAAFLNAKEEYFRKNKTDNFYFDKSRLIIDVGSSTVDISAYSKDNNNLEPLHDGHPLLGARIIDYFLTDYFIEKMSSGSDSALFHDLLEKNTDLFMQLVLACRLAKEECYSNPDKRPFISFLDEFDERINYQILEKIENLEIGSILHKYLDVSDSSIASVGNRSWKEEFKSFLQKNKAVLVNDFGIEQIILTGSASKMPFIGDVCREVFDNITDEDFIIDLDPAACIADGLAMMGASREKSKLFRKNCDDFLKQGVPVIVSKHYTDNFAEEIGTIVYDTVVDDIIIPTSEKWSINDEKSSLKDLENLVKNNTSGTYLIEVLNQNQDYTDKIISLSNKISGDLNEHLAVLFDGNTSFDGTNPNKIEELKKINFTGSTFDLDFSDLLAGISSAVISCIGWIGIIVGGIFIATCLGIATPIIAAVGTLLGKNVQKWADETYDRVKRSSSESAQNSMLDKKKKEVYVERFKQKLKDTRAENILKIKSDLLDSEQKSKIICSITQQIEPVIQKAQQKIEYLIEDEEN